MLFTGLFIPFLGTAAGSAAVFFMKNKTNHKVQRLLLGFASGVMVAASVWSLLLPSIEMTKKGRLSFLPAAAGLIFGTAILILLDCVATSFYKKRNSEHGIKKTAMLITAVTLHNIPEGMAVGVTFAAALGSHPKVTIAAAMALSIGIAIQNFPEGAIISMPLKARNVSKRKAFLAGVLSGAVEPVFGFASVILTRTIESALPYFLSFAAGAMLYVVVEELIPEANEKSHSYIPVIGFTAGFAAMMILDVAFG